MRSAIKNKNFPCDFWCNSDYVYISVVVKGVILVHAGLIKQIINNIMFYVIILLCCCY